MTTNADTKTASRYESGVLYEGYSMDFTSRIEFVMRADGSWFNRWQYRDPRYGYKWSAWRQTVEPTTASRASFQRKVRLPK